MILYNENGLKKNYYPKEKIGGGTTGTVYHLDEDSCIKIYKELDNGIEKETISEINNLNLKNFYKIYELLSDKNSNFKGYTMKYYKPKYMDILTKDTDYMLHNLFEIYKSINILSENRIFVTDLHTDNIIIGDDITVIDIDTYCKSLFFNEEKLKKRNIRALLCLFRDVLIEALYKYHNYEDEDIDILEDLFDKDNPEEVRKQLIRCKYPIDYIKKK